MTENAATQDQQVEGVAETDEKPGRLPRDQFLNDLAKRQSEKHVTDTAEMERLYADAPAETSAEQPVVEAEAPKTWEDEEDELKVDGQSVKRRRAEIYEAGKKALQKESAADKRLEEASRLLREAQIRAQASGQQADAQPQNQAVQQKAVDDAERAKRYSEIVNKIRYASDEDAVSATRELEGFIAEQAATRAQRATLEALSQQIPNAVRSQVEFQQTAQWFLQEFNDIAQDPYLGPMAAMMEAAARQKGDTRPHRALWTDIGNSLRQRFGGKAVVGMEEKAAKKAAVPDQPKAVSKAAPSAPPEKTREESRSDYFKTRNARALRQGQN